MADNLVTVYHGTSVEAAHEIEKTGLRPQGDHRSAFVTTERDHAVLFAEAWTAREMALGKVFADVPVGAVVVMRVAKKRLSPDTYNHLTAPIYFMVEGGVTPAEIERVEFVELADLLDANAYEQALDYWKIVVRPRRNPNLRRENVPTCSRCGGTDSGGALKDRLFAIWMEPPVCWECVTPEEIAAHLVECDVPPEVIGARMLEWISFGLKDPDEP